MFITFIPINNMQLLQEERMTEDVHLEINLHDHGCLPLNGSTSTSNRSHILTKGHIYLGCNLDCITG